jgi:hypothetical protein
MRETPVGKEEGYGEGATPKSPSYMSFQDEIMRGWRKYVEMLEKQAKCTHSVMFDATGKVGICVLCGATIKRERRV